MRNKEKIKIMFLRSGLRDSDVVLGAEQVILHIARNLDKTRFYPVITCISDTPSRKVPLLAEAERSGIAAECLLISSRYDLIAAVRELAGLLKKYDIDILHCHEYKSDALGFFTRYFYKTKVITTVHGWTGCDWRVKLYEFFDALLIRNFEKIIAVSRPLGKMLKEKNFPPAKLEVISNGLDEKTLVPDTDAQVLRERWAISRRSKIIGTVGRLSPEKGQRYFIDAAAEIINEAPDSHFIVVGDGPLKKYLTDYARRKGLEGRISFVGFQSNVADYLSLMDIFVLPSLKETFGLALLEAFFMAKPVVSTAVGIAPEIIRDGDNGMLVRIKDAAAIKKAVVALLTDAALARRLGQNAKNEAAKEYTVKTMVDKYQGVYESIGGKPKNR